MGVETLLDQRGSQRMLTSASWRVAEPLTRSKQTQSPVGSRSDSLTALITVNDIFLATAVWYVAFDIVAEGGEQETIMRAFTLALTAVTLSAAGTAMAAPVPDGTVSSVALVHPTINLSSNPATYSAVNGRTFEISGTDGFSAIGGTAGTLNGTLTFSKTVGVVLPETLANFFVFSDAQGGTVQLFDD